MQMPFLIAAALAATLVLGPARAAPLVLELGSDAVPDFADGSVDEGDASSVRGLTATFSDVQPFDGGARGFVDLDGIALGRVGPTIVSLSLTFGRDTIIAGYGIDFNDVPDEVETFFQLAGPNGLSGLNPLSETGEFAFDMGGIPRFLAGETYTLVHNVPEDVASQIDEFFVLAAVPLPLPAGALLAGLGALAWVRRRA